MPQHRVLYLKGGDGRAARDKPNKPQHKQVHRKKITDPDPRDRMSPASW
jgi:predicted membrane-bound spermidine synthase